jgi:hypothetical protein
VSLDVRHKIQRAISGQPVFDGRLHAAKSLIDECPKEWAGAARVVVAQYICDHDPSCSFAASFPGNILAGRDGSAKLTPASIGVTLRANNRGRRVPLLRPCRTTGHARAWKQGHQDQLLAARPRARTPEDDARAASLRNAMAEWIARQK